MFAFGVLKFVHPFMHWYSVQITSSGLNNTAYAMGISGEIIVGVLIVSSLSFSKRLSLKLFSVIMIISSFMIAGMMIVGIYVHLHPGVPADVLPMKIKPPYIPIFFLLLAIIQAAFVAKQFRNESSSDTQIKMLTPLVKIECLTCFFKALYIILETFSFLSYYIPVCHASLVQILPFHKEPYT